MSLEETRSSLEISQEKDKNIQHNMMSATAEEPGTPHCPPTDENLTTLKEKRKAPASDDDSSSSDSSSDSEDSEDDKNSTNLTGRLKPETQARRKLKKQRKMQIKAVNENKGTAQDYIDVFGADAHAELELKPAAGAISDGSASSLVQHVKARDLHALLLWVLTESVNPPWVFVRHRPLVRRVVLVVVEGLTQRIVTQYAHLLPTLHQLHLTHKPAAGGPPTPLPPLSLHVPCSLHSALCVLQHHLSCAIERIRGYKKAAVRIGSLELFTGAQGNAAARATAARHTPAQTHLAGASATEPATTPAAEAAERWDRLSSHPGAAAYLAMDHDLREAGYPLPDTVDMAANASAGAGEEEATGDVAADDATTLSTAARDAVVEDIVDAGADQATAAPGGPRRNVYGNTRPFVATWVHSVDPRVAQSATDSAADADNASTTTLLPTCMDAVEWDPQQLSLLRAVDCEMVLTARGYELARVTVLGAREQVLLDVFVKPEAPVTNYLTEFSGVQPRHLASPQALSFLSARARVLSLLSAHHILVGHSLENDLRALRIVHRRVLDTALLYPHPRGGTVRQSLKALAQRHLNLSIQNKGRHGHDSIEDAAVALRLARYKILQGPEYGVVPSQTGALLDILEQLKCPQTIVAGAHVCKRFGVATTSCVVSDSDEDAVERAKNTGTGLTVVHLSDFGYAMEGRERREARQQREGDEEQPRNFIDPAGVSAETLPTLLQLEEDIDPTPHLARIDACVGKLWESLPRNTMMMVVSGQGCVRRARQATQRGVVLRNVMARLGGVVECVWAGPRPHELHAEVSHQTEANVTQAGPMEQGVDQGDDTVTAAEEEKKASEEVSVPLRKVVLQQEVERFEKLAKDIVAMNNRGVCFLNIK